MTRRTSFHPVLIILFFFLVLLIIAPALASGKNDGMEELPSMMPLLIIPAAIFNSALVLFSCRGYGARRAQKQARCGTGPFRKTSFSIGHHGAPLQFPENTVESYRAVARMGAGILECDVTFTRDKERVCRHSQCDLHTTSKQNHQLQHTETRRYRE